MACSGGLLWFYCSSDSKAMMLTKWHGYALDFHPLLKTFIYVSLIISYQLNYSIVCHKFTYKIHLWGEVGLIIIGLGPHSIMKLRIIQHRMSVSFKSYINWDKGERAGGSQSSHRLSLLVLKGKGGVCGQHPLEGGKIQRKRQILVGCLFHPH